MRWWAAGGAARWVGGWLGADVFAHTQWQRTPSTTGCQAAATVCGGGSNGEGNGEGGGRRRRQRPSIGRKTSASSSSSTGAAHSTELWVLPQVARLVEELIQDLLGGDADCQVADVDLALLAVDGHGLGVAGSESRAQQMSEG